MLDLQDALGRHAAQALKDRFPAAKGAVPELLPVTKATKVEFGDLQISAALQLAKPLSQKPRDLAQVIAEALATDEAVAKTEVAGPGFVNVTLKDAWLQTHARDASGPRAVGSGQRVVIDYSSPNVAKPMHIGHIRSTIIGDACKRVLRAVGYEVIADNHLGDWGTQFGKLIVAYRLWLDEKAFAEDPVGELLRLYVKFVDEEKRQRGEAKAITTDEALASADDEEITDDAPPILKEARAELVKLQQGDAENVALWQTFIEVSRREFERVYRRLGVTFDVWLGESFYNDRLADTVRLLVDKGIAESSQGAMVVFFKKPDGTDEMPPMLVRKKDGGFLYGTTDVAGLLYRVERWNPARIVILTDERQQLHFKQLFAVGKRLGVQASLEHVWFGLMRLPEGTISTREGKLIGLEALLDEAERRAFQIAGESNPELDEAERREVARVVGMGAVKYNDLSKDRQTLVTFTWDKALSLTGNTAPYLQYAYARIRSILRKAKETGAESGPIEALSPTERALVVKVLGFGDAVEQVARTARPHILCDYLFELAGAFSTFYTDHPVLKAEPPLRASRLQLCAIVAETLERGLELLGIEVLERM